MNNWTKEQDAFLIENFRKMRAAEIGKALGRTKAAIHRRASKIGLAGVNQRWTKEEENILRVAYAEAANRPYMSKCLAEVATKLGRNQIEVSARANRLGMSFRKIKKRRDSFRGRPCVVGRDGKMAFEHTVVMESMIGRQLAADEVVHHVNCIKDDNRPENLFLCTRSQHASIHSQLNGLVGELMRRGVVRFERSNGTYELYEEEPFKLAAD